jgi:hypothetical protein
MATLIAKCAAFTDGRSMGQGTRLGEDQAVGEANTRTTFSKTVMLNDGSGYTELRRGPHLVRLQWNAEDLPLTITQFTGQGEEA